MEVQSVMGGAPSVDGGAQAKQAEQAQEQAKQVAAAEAPRQETSAGLAPGVGQNLNITV